MVWSIDLDRGVISSNHPTLNMDIFMYVDDPGAYLTAHGQPVDEKLAAQAGFEVEKYAKARKIKLALAAATAEVMDKFGVPKSDVVETRDGFKLVDVGSDRYNVVSPEGDTLNTLPLARAQADILLDHLAPKVVEVVDPKPEKDSKPKEK